MSNHRNIVKGVITVLLCTLMSACTGFATTQPSSLQPTITPQIPEKVTVESKTLSVISATARPSSTPTPYIQPTSKPTSTLNPSPTATIKLPTVTIDPQTILTKQVYNLVATQLPSFHAACQQFPLNNASLSPNGKWLAIHCKQNQTLEIKNKDGKQWVLNFKDFPVQDLAKDSDSLRGSLYPDHWSSDDQYLYFGFYVAADMGGICYFGSWYQGLYRINVNTGIVSATLPPLTKWWESYEITFSPDGEKLAYSAGDPMILDLRTGEITAIDDAIGEIGNLTWSPDSSQLAYVTCRTPDGITINNSTLEIYSLATHKSMTVLDLAKARITIELWNENQLRIAVSDSITGKFYYSIFDWSSGELITPSPTPTP